MKNPTSSRFSARPGHGVAPALMALAALGALGAARAQTAPAPAAAAPQRVLITGQAASLRNALDTQEAADHIVSALSADGIGQLPDINAAEALQRLPGLSVERDQGEGRYVRIRGLGADFNSVTINGALVPAPDAERRGVAMDVLPAGLVRSLEVSKTLTPDRDANAIGGTVEVKTLSAFDHPGRFMTMDLGASHDGNTGRNSPRLGLALSERLLDNTLGVAVGLSLDRRRFGSDNVETGGAWDDGALEEFERRRYTIQRDRSALAMNLDWRPAPGRKVWLQGFLSRFTDHEQRESQIVSFEDAQTAGQRGEAEVTRALKDRTETQTIRSLVLGTEQAVAEDWTLQARLGSSRSGEDEPQHLGGAEFGGTDPFANVGFEDTRRPRLLGPDSLYAAGSYELSKVKLSRLVTADRESHGALDLRHPWELGSQSGELKFGVKLSQRHKTSDEDVWKIKAKAVDGDTGMGAFTQGTVDYAWGDFGPGLSSDRIRDRLKGLDLADFEDETGSAENDFSVRERIRAGYVMSTLDGDDWRLTGGVRWEGTHTQARGTKIDDDGLSAVDVSRDRGAWLPSLHLRQDLDRTTAVRAAWSNAVVRPTFAQLAPGTVIDGDEASFGNPDLKPLRAANFDLGIEHRLDRDGAISAYVFHKRIRDFIYRTDLAGSGAWADFSQAQTWANGGQARVTGLELSWSQALRQLPAPFDGLIVGANASFTRSHARIGAWDADAGATATRSIPLPSQSDRVLNLMLGYEAGPWSVRLAANHKSAYLLEVADVRDEARDQYVAAQTQLDFSARWQIDKAWQLNLEVQNLTNTRYDVWADSSRYNVQSEQYGRTLKLGLKWTMY